MRSIFVVLLIFLLLPACGGGDGSSQGTDDFVSQNISVDNEGKKAVLQDAVINRDVLAGKEQLFLENRIKLSIEPSNEISIDFIEKYFDSDRYLFHIESGPKFGKAYMKNNRYLFFTANPNYTYDELVISVYLGFEKIATIDIDVDVQFNNELPPVVDSPNCYDGNCVAGSGYYGESCENWLKRTGQWNNTIKVIISQGNQPYKWVRQGVCVYKKKHFITLDPENGDIIIEKSCFESTPDLKTFLRREELMAKPVSFCYDISKRTYNIVSY